MNRSSSKRPGRLFIISAPSGAGKSTLCQAALAHFKDMRYSISSTTRSPRGNEKNGVDYHFISREAFAAGIKAGQWAEWAEVHGNYYGTSADFIERTLASGQDVLLDIDVQGTFKLLEKFPESITIFIMPPTFEALRQRMESRGTDRPEVIETRVENARKEMAYKDRYRHVIINDSLPNAAAELNALIQTYRQSKTSEVL